MNFLLLILLIIAFVIIIINTKKIHKLQDDIKIHDILEKKIKDMKEKAQLQVEVNGTTSKDQGKGEIIMVVDDEETIVTLIGLFLSSNNFEPKEFTSTEEALKYFKDNSNIVDVIITDYSMPEQTDGMEFVKKIKKIKSDIPVIIITGHEYVKLDDPNDKSLISKYLTKPLTHKDLIDTVFSVLKEKEDKNE